jgi:NAD(P)-dependent dehydrogenase (short-subunit alcohol dehydrogenase family)
VAFVTGAGGSIGEACVLQFARDGVTRIAGADLSVTGLERTASALRKEYPAVNFISLMADLSDELQVQRVFQQIIKRFGRIDYAVNNAAIAAPLSSSSEGDFKALEKVLDVNLKGVWLCEREELKLMLTQELTPASLTSVISAPDHMKKHSLTCHK